MKHGRTRVFPVAARVDIVDYRGIVSNFDSGLGSVTRVGDARRWAAVPLLCLGLLAAGCGLGPVESVHALRLYEREDVRPALVKQHLDDLSTTLALIKRILHDTKYRPGDAWARALALNDATAGQATERIRQEQHGTEPPTTLAVYSRHVLETLARADEQANAIAQALPDAVPSAVPNVVPDAVPNAVPQYGSILDALAQVDPALAQLRADFETGQRLAQEVKDAKAEEITAASSNYNAMIHAARRLQNATKALAQYQDTMERQAGRSPVQSAQAKQVVKDALSSASVALRLANEAAALASMLLLEIPRLASLPSRDYAGQVELAMALINDGPKKVDQIRTDLEVDLQSLKELVGALARLDTVDIGDVPGFAYHEGLVDDIVGFTTDLLHFNADAGSEAYFFNSFATEGGRDYSGRTFKVRYHVDPILLASARLSASFDLSRLPQAGGLKFGYATNRVYQSGGTIENRSFADELGATGRWSDAIDAALLYSGWQASVRAAHFTSGTVDLVQAADGATAQSAPFTFTLKQIDFSKELVSYGSPYIKSAVVHFGYFDYTLPRILYEFQNATPDQKDETWVYDRETPAQPVRTQLLTWGTTVRVEYPLARGLDILFGFNLSWGFGAQKFYFVNSDGSHEDHHPFTVALSAFSDLGLRWRFVGVSSRFHASLEAIYQAQYLNSSLGSTLGLDHKIPLASSDLFHGPRAGLSASF